MRTGRVHATGCVILNEFIELDVDDDATGGEIEARLLEVAREFFDEQVSLANGMELDIELGTIDVEEHES